MRYIISIIAVVFAVIGIFSLLEEGEVSQHDDMITLETTAVDASGRESTVVIQYPKGTDIAEILNISRSAFEAKTLDRATANEQMAIKTASSERLWRFIITMATILLLAIIFRKEIVANFTH